MAEQDEIAIGLTGGLLLPDFDSTSPTAFALATWRVGLAVSYGVLDDLSVTGAFSFSTFSARAPGVHQTDYGLDYLGTLRFDCQIFHPEVGLRYKLFSGYNLAPYVEASVGYLWLQVRDPRLLNEDELIYAIGLGDFSRGAWTVSGGLALDYRLLETVFVGLEVRFTFALGDSLLRQAFELPLTVSYYW